MTGRLVSHARGALALAAFVGLLTGCQRSGNSDVIAQRDLLDRLQDTPAPIVLDVRTPREFQSGHVPGAVNIEYRQIPSRLADLAAVREREVVVYCEVGPRAQVAQDILQQAGFTNVRHLQGDMRAWRQDRLPVAR
jgi:rhodanese-related sulfurtransferase